MPRSGEDATAGLHPENTVLSEDPGVGCPLGEQGLGPWLLAVRRWMPSSGKEEQSRSSSRFGGISKGGSGSGEQAAGPAKEKQGTAGGSVQASGGSGEHAAGPAKEKQVAAPDGGGWVKPVKVARRSSPSRPSSPVKGIVTGSYFAGLRAAGGGDPDPIGGDGLQPSVGPSVGSAGRFKRARPAPQLFSPAATEKGKCLEGGGGELALVVQKKDDFLDVRSEQKTQLLELGKNKGKATIVETGRELSEFIFTAGGLKGDPTNPLKPIAPLSDSHPAPALLLSDQAHLAAVGRLRLAIVEDGDQSTMMEDSYEGVDEDMEGGGSGVTPLSHQASE